MRILLVDDDPRLLKGLRMRLELEPGIAIVGEAADGTAALACLDELAPDIVVTDLEMPGMDGFALTRLITDRHPACRVIVHSLHDDPTVRKRAIAAGATHFVSKHDGPETLLATIRRGQAAAIPSTGDKLEDET
jgi:DNA-binding NarL/FixJ family response regulator